MSNERRRVSTSTARRPRCARRFTRLLGEPLEPRLLLTLTPQLLADINTGGLSVSLYPTIVSIGSVAYFAGKDSGSTSVLQLWRSDGTQAGTHEVKHIPDGGLGIQQKLTVVGNTLFFAASDAVHGRELWKSDGTEAGTVLVKDINPGTGNSLQGAPREIAMINVNGTLFFKANGGVELWKSDGTEEGTVLVKNGLSGSVLVNFNGTLYFPSTGGLWKSDGTPEGTVLVKSIAASSLTVVGSTLYFVANASTSTPQLYKSDGTTNGTIPLKDFPSFIPPVQLTNFNGTLFFAAFDVADNLGYDLWKSDGSPTGTVRVKDLPPQFGVGSFIPEQFTVSGQTLFFVNGDKDTGIELWKSDGTPEGTSIVKDVMPSPGFAGVRPQNLTNVNGELYFSLSDHLHPGTGTNLWKSDGTPDGTVAVKEFFYGIDSELSEAGLPLLANVNGTLFFRANSVIGYELWKSDGTPDGTVTVPRAGTATASAIASTQQILVGDSVYFLAHTQQTGVELARTDGTSQGTYLVKDVKPGQLTSQIIFFAEAAGKVYFSAEDGVHGRELWVSNGTDGGTYLLQDMCAGACGTVLGSPVNQNGRLYFAADDGVHGRQSWQTDGTPGGTVLDLDQIAARSTGATINDVTLFAASDGVNGTELWKSDGTTAGTVMLKEIRGGSASSDPQELTVFQGKVFFAATDGSGSRTLWMSDGTPEGTVIVQDGSTGTLPGSPTNLFVVNGQLLFMASDSHGQKLWRSDGTAGGTVLVTGNISPSSFCCASDIGTLNDKLIFTADDGTHGRELWMSDGTADGTFLVKDINAGSGSSSLQDFNFLNGVLVFIRDDGSSAEVWRSDGTTPGTYLLKDRFSEGVNGATSLAPINGAIFFAAGSGQGLWKTDGTTEGTSQLIQSSVSGLADIGGMLLFANGKDSIWTSDGTPAGTRQLAIVAPASSPSGFFSVGGNLVYAASDAAHGAELWTLIDVNVAPSFTKGADIGVTDEQAGKPRIFSPWATAVSAGPTDEVTQQLTFLVENDNHGLFSQQPKIDPDGTLKFTLLPNVEGTATVTVKLEDGGGTANGGADASGTQTFTIDVTKKHRWHNETPPYTPVNRGGMEVLFEDDLHSITSTDVLLIINYLNAGLPTKIPASDPVANGTTQPFYDVDGDDSVTSTDALLIINVLNAGQGGPVGGEGEGVFAAASSPHPNSQVALADLIALLALDTNELATRRRRG